MAEPALDRGRGETPEERLDRKFDDLLQELRVMQTGAQLTAGFLLTLPFQDSFSDLDRIQLALYLVLVALAALTTILVMAPVAIHRRLVGRRVKEKVVGASHRFAQLALLAISLLIVGMVVLIFDMVVTPGWALAAGAATAATLVALLVVTPARILGDRAEAEGPEGTSASERPGY